MNVNFSCHLDTFLEAEVDIHMAVQDQVILFTVESETD
jgi:hypothetical protein